MAKLTDNPLIGLIMLIIGIAFLLVAAACYFLAYEFGLIISVISSFILILTGGILHFYTDSSPAG